MGYDVDFLGHLDIDPALIPAEIDHIRALGENQRYRPGRAFPPRSVRRTSSQPSPRCQWDVCERGCCLAWDGSERFYEEVEWLEYLVDHLLRPKAAASRTGDPQFEDFSFDHVLDGVIVGCRTDTGELFAITVRRNKITTSVLHAGRTSYVDWAPELVIAPPD